MISGCFIGYIVNRLDKNCNIKIDKENRTMYDVLECILFVAMKGDLFMAVKRRKDNKNRVLKEGEYQRTSGTYEFKWRDKRGFYNHTEKKQTEVAAQKCREM